MGDLNESEPNQHTTVLLHEAVEWLVTSPSGFYIDGTFGRGGHSGQVLSRLDSSGRLMAIDRDPVAISSGKARFGNETRVQFEQAEFSQARELVEREGRLGKVAGILLDLGVSSPQLDDTTRGFSFMRDGPLDMRMSPDKGMSAADWLNTAELEDIRRVLKVYGEEKFAKRIATAIVSQREVEPLTTTKACLLYTSPSPRDS